MSLRSAAIVLFRHVACPRCVSPHLSTLVCNRMFAGRSMPAAPSSQPAHHSSRTAMQAKLRFTLRFTLPAGHLKKRPGSIRLAAGRGGCAGRPRAAAPRDGTLSAARCDAARRDAVRDSAGSRTQRARGRVTCCAAACPAAPAASRARLPAVSASDVEVNLQTGGA